MDLINELGSDMAFAFLVEQNYHEKLNSREAIILIDRVRTELQRLMRLDNPIIDVTLSDPSRISVSH